MVKELYIRKEGKEDHVLIGEYRKILRKVLKRKILEKVGGKVGIVFEGDAGLFEGILKRYGVEGRDGMVRIEVFFSEDMDVYAFVLKIHGGKWRDISLSDVVEGILNEVGFNPELCEKRVEEFAQDIADIVEIVERIYAEERRKLEASELYRLYLEMEVARAFDNSVKGGKDEG